MNQCLHRVKGILSDIDQEERGTEEEGEEEGREGMEYSELLLSLSQHFISSDVHLFTSYLLNLSEVSEGEKESKGEERERDILHAHSLFLLFLVSW